MNAEIYQFYKVVKDIYLRIQNSNLINHLNTANQIASQIVNSTQVNPQLRTRSQKQSETIQQEVFKALRSILPHEISAQENNIYESVDAFNLFGIEGEQRLTNIFSQMTINSNGFRAELNKYQADVNKILSLYNSLSLFESKLVSDSNNENDQNSIIIFFQGGAEINFLKELGKVSNRWNKDLISFALLVGENNTDFRIESVKRGSIILSLLASAEVVKVFSETVKAILDVILKYLKINKLASDARIAQVPKKIIDQLEENSKLNIENEAQIITSQLMKSHQPDQERNDIKTGVLSAVSHLLTFINDGGKVDIKLIHQGDDGKRKELNLNASYSEIKQIEGNVEHENGSKPILELTAPKGTAEEEKDEKQSED